MGWTAKVDDESSPMAWTTLTDHLAYKLMWQFNQPAKLTLVVDDNSGGNSQTYGDAFMGTSSVIIEQPTATEIFRGRLTGATADVRKGTLTLKGADWLSQLEDDYVIYDTREILDPDATNSLREYQLRPYLNDGSRCNALWEAIGNTNVDLAVDDLGDWSADLFNDGFTSKLILSNSHMGEQTSIEYPYDEVVTLIQGDNIQTDAGDETDIWIDDANKHQVDFRGLGANPWGRINYDIKTLTASSGLIGSIDAMRITIVYDVTGVWIAGNGVGVGFNTLSGGGGGVSHFVGQLNDDENKHRETFDVDGVVLAAMDNDADYSLEVLGLGGAFGDGGIDIYYLKLEIDYTVDTAITTQYQIDDTRVTAGVVNNLDIDGQTMETDGVCDWWDFCIARCTTYHVDQVLTTYDTLHTLTNDDVTASTNYVGRHYHRMKPLDIIKDLALVDNTDFYLAPWDGDSLDLVYNKSYAGPGTAWTDASVLSWTTPRRSLQDVVNTVYVEGYKSKDQKIAETDTDAASVAAYGQRGKYVNNPDIVSKKDADDMADALVTRLKDVPYHLSAMVDGFSTVNLGDVLTVTSTKLNLAAVTYLVVRKEYDSRDAITSFSLSPMADYLNLEPHLDNLLRDIRTRIDFLNSHLERENRYTSGW